MTKQLNADELDRLTVIKDKIQELVYEAKSLVNGTSEEARAKGYWYAAIRMALDDEHDFMGRGGSTLQDTIESLAVEADMDNSAHEASVENEAAPTRQWAPGEPDMVLALFSAGLSSDELKDISSDGLRELYASMPK